MAWDNHLRNHLNTNIHRFPEGARNLTPSVPHETTVGNGEIETLRAELGRWFQEQQQKFELEINWKTKIC